jgi:hypothetical protein
MSPPIDWNGIEPTEEAWARVLDELVSRARRAVKATQRERLRVADDLTRFIAMSPIAMSRLDVIAKRAAEALLDANLTTALAQLSDRATELEEHLAALRQGGAST